MRRSNIVAIAVLLIVSLLLLWLWKYLGFSLHDPIDFTIAVVWWLVLAAIIVAIIIVEQRRRAYIRTIFVSDGILYNCETGIVRLESAPSGGFDYIKGMSKVLDSLNYGPEAVLSHDQPRVRFDYIVHTKRFSNNGNVWNGEVLSVRGSHKTRSFYSAQDLQGILYVENNTL